MTNLLTAKEKRSVRNEYYLRAVAIALTLVFITVVFGVAELLPSYFYSSVSERIAQNEFESLQAEVAEDTESLNELERTEALLSFISERESERHPTTSIVDEALDAKPENVEVNKLSFERSSGETVFVVSGVAPTRSDLIAFSDGLDQQPNFTSTNVPAEQLAQTTNIEFSIRISGEF